MSIHKKRRKIEICHNCHTILSLENNFCPHCGQENHDLKVPIGHLAFEVFEGFTHFDTKFYNTMKAIFLSPGKITKDFLEGRRERYVQPIRLYLLISFFFFEGLGSMVELAVKDGGDFFTDNFIKTDKTEKANKKLQKAVDDTHKKVLAIQNSENTSGLFEAIEKEKQAVLALRLYKKIEKKSNYLVSFYSISIDEILDEMNIEREDTLRKLIKNLSEQKQHLRLIDIQKQIIADTINTEPITEINSEMRDYFMEVIGKKQQLSYSLNLHAMKNNSSTKINYDTDTIITIKGSNGSLENTTYRKKVLKMTNDELDSLNLKNDNINLPIQSLNRGFLKNMTYYQLAFNEDAQKATAELAQLSIGVFSLMMFILMPIVAFLLKVIYSKRTHSIISYPFRLLRYLWDWLLYLIRFLKIRKYRTIPHLLVGHTRYYYEHLIFSIHIHAVFFLMLIIFVGGGIVLGLWKIAFFIVTMLGFFLYFIISLKVVYRQGIFKTLFKSLILFVLYFISFLMVMSLTSAIKFALW